jgi:hypothetical protein
MPCLPFVPRLLAYLIRRFPPCLLPVPRFLSYLIRRCLPCPDRQHARCPTMASMARLYLFKLPSPANDQQLRLRCQTKFALPCLRFVPRLLSYKIRRCLPRFVLTYVKGSPTTVVLLHRIWLVLAIFYHYRVQDYPNDSVSTPCLIVAVTPAFRACL